MSTRLFARGLTATAGVAALALCLVGAPRAAWLLGLLGAAGFATFLVVGRAAAATVGSVGVVLAAAVDPIARQVTAAALGRLGLVAVLLVVAVLSADAAETLPRTASPTGWGLIASLAGGQAPELIVAAGATAVSGAIAALWATSGDALVLAGMALAGCAMWLASRRLSARRPDSPDVAEDRDCTHTR